MGWPECGAAPGGLGKVGGLQEKQTQRRGVSRRLGRDLCTHGLFSLLEAWVTGAINHAAQATQGEVLCCECRHSSNIVTHPGRHVVAVQGKMGLSPDGRECSDCQTGGGGRWIPIGMDYGWVAGATNGHDLAKACKCEMERRLRPKATNEEARIRPLGTSNTLAHYRRPL